MKIKSLLEKFLKPQEHSLKLQSMRAAIWTLLGKGGGSFLNLVSNLILTRLLFPEAFGLMATATIFIHMVQIFTDTGISTALIQNPRSAEHRYLNTAWVISIVRGFFLFFFVLTIITPIANFYEQPELKSLLFALSFGVIIPGFNNPALPLIIKRLRAEKQVAFELGSQFSGFIITVILAYIMKDVWALVIGYLLTSIFRLIGSYMVESYRPRLQWDAEAGRELFHFGKFILLNTLLTWAALNVDTLIIGKVLGMEELGFYNIGIKLARLFEMFIIHVTIQSYFPAVSQVHKDLPRVMAIFRRTISLALALTVPLLLLQALFSSELIGFLYDSRYQNISIILYWFCISGVFRTISLVQSSTLIALGRPIYETIVMGMALVGVLIFLPICASEWGLTGAGLAFLGVAIFVSLAEGFFLYKKIGFSYSLIIRSWFQTLAISGIILAVHHLLVPWLSSSRYYNLGFIAIMTVIAFSVSGGFYLMLEGRTPFRDQLPASKKGPVTQ